MTARRAGIALLRSRSCCPSGSRPWEDLTSLSQVVQSEWFQLGIYFICTVRKPGKSELQTPW